MSSRRSSRTKAAVKYTSDSEGSDFAPTKLSKPAPKQRSQPTPKKRKASQALPPSPSSTPTKRTKRSPSTLASDAATKAAAKASLLQQKATEAQHKQTWTAWLAANDLGGKLLPSEPGRDESITQTDAGKKYGLKPAELGCLRHWEKKNTYGKGMKLFLEEEVKVLAGRKEGALAGKGDE